MALGPGSSSEQVALHVGALTSTYALYDRASGRLLELDPPWLDISATGIRERIGSGRTPRYLVPERVWAEIQRMGLYGACPAKNF